MAPVERTLTLRRARLAKLRPPGIGQAEAATASWSWEWQPPHARSGGDSNEDLKDDVVGSPSSPPSVTSSVRRRRGQRGGETEKKGEKKWRSGQIPPPPEFDGGTGSNPFGLRIYKRSLERWCRITREFLPPNEQALRAILLDFKDVSDDMFDAHNGTDVLFQALDKHFGEKELYRRGGVIRESACLPPSTCHQPVATNQLPPTNCQQQISTNQLPPTNCHQPIATHQLPPTN